MVDTVKFQVPDHVSLTDDRLDGSEVRVEYRSNYTRGGPITVTGLSELSNRTMSGFDTELVVDGKRVGPNGHVFGEDGRHIGTDATVHAVLPLTEAIELVTDGHSYDIDDAGGDEVIVQAWDKSVMESEGFMEGTMSVIMRRV